ncbi:TIGR01777 family oxidoreductase [Rubritalea spongiae]|uniref:TIGR01777 family oxidoreductase n=1 Tax=Rubritalea spongiae TaxID=430797 RepID=A0ABW5EAP0_9BACT
MKTIVIVAANGFLGRVLSRYFLQQGWNVVGIAREPYDLIDGVDFVYWDGKQLGEWAEALEWVDVLVNLAGRSVNCRYGERNKKAIMDSRVGTTHLLGEAVRGCKNPPKVWINSSTATIYRHAEDRPQGDADGEIGTGFSVEVAKAWEKAFMQQNVEGVRQVALRTAIVISEEAETVWTVLQGLARYNLGGKMGKGTQRVSWITDNDFARAVEWIALKDSASGTYNVAAPHPVTNTAFMRLVRESVGKRFGIASNRWMLELGAFVRRTEIELILKSRWVIPTRLLEEGFTFEYPTIEQWMGGADGH